MGALHDGHASLMRVARAGHVTGPVVVSIFVNPMQFGPTEDLDRYPRTLDADLEVCAAEGVDVVFAPSVEEMYPGGFSHDSVHDGVTVAPGALATILDGESRPGPLRRRAHRRRQALRPGAARRRRLRPEGLPAARPDPPDGARPLPGHRGRRRGDRPRGRRPRALQPQPLPRPRAASRPPSRSAARCGPRRSARRTAYLPRAGPRWPCSRTSRGIELDYLALTSPDLGDAPEVGEGRILVAARVGTHAAHRQHGDPLRPDRRPGGDRDRGLDHH